MAGQAASAPKAVRERWDRRPRDIRHSDAEVGTREYSHGVEAWKCFVEPRIPAFAEFERWRGEKGLGMDCGIGAMAASFARAGADHAGADVSGASLELGRRRSVVHGLPGRFHSGNAKELTEAMSRALETRRERHTLVRCVLS